MKFLLHFACSVLVSSLCVAEETEFTIGPDYADAPETKEQPGVPKGKIDEFTMDSKDSRIYKGIAKDKKGRFPISARSRFTFRRNTGQARKSPFIVVQDGIGYRGRAVEGAGQHDRGKALPVMVAVFINSGGGDSLGSQRGLEYDTVDDTYSKFIEKEVLPKISKDYHIKFTTRPRRPRDDGRQLRRRGGVHHGVVSPGTLSEGAHLLRHLRGPAVSRRPREPRTARGNTTRT